MPVFRDLEDPSAETTRLDARRVQDLQAQEIKEDDPGAQKKKQALADSSKLVNFSAVDRELIIRWLVKDYRVVFGGEPISGPRKLE
jgi:hypothetical protein